MSLPCANALVERLFSNLKKLKVTVETHRKEKLLHGKQGMASLGITADELSVHDHPKMLKLL